MARPYDPGGLSSYSQCHCCRFSSQGGGLGTTVLCWLTLQRVFAGRDISRRCNGNGSGLEKQAAAFRFELTAHSMPRHVPGLTLCYRNSKIEGSATLSSNLLEHRSSKRNILCSVLGQGGMAWHDMRLRGLGVWKPTGLFSSTGERIMSFQDTSPMWRQEPQKDSKPGSGWSVSYEVCLSSVSFRQMSGEAQGHARLQGPATCNNVSSHIEGSRGTSLGSQQSRKPDGQ
ncbi:unnamed protein product [Diplocarpon coronariae]